MAISTSVIFEIFDSSFLELLKQEFVKLQKLEKLYPDQISQDEMQSQVNNSIQKIWQYSGFILRGIGKTAYQANISEVIQDKNDSIVIKGKKQYQSWTLNPAYGFYYAIGGGGNGYVIVLQKYALGDQGRVMIYGRLNPIMEKGDFDFDVPWNFWRELEIRTKSRIEVPKSSVLIFTQSKQLQKKFLKMSLEVVLVKSLWSERERLRKLTSVELR